MSSMFDPTGAGAGPPAGPPDSIQVGGGGPDPSGKGAPHGPSRGDHTDALNQAISALSDYIQGESDEADIAAAHKIVADIAKLRSSQQDLVDKATGAGPGARLLRKASGGGSQY